MPTNTFCLDTEESEYKQKRLVKVAEWQFFKHLSEWTVKFAGNQSRTSLGESWDKKLEVAPRSSDLFSR